jgi:putative ABC transport system permease protein
MRNLQGICKLAIKGLLASKQRTLLTILSVSIGVASVVTLMSIGKGNEKIMVSRLESLGTNSLFITPGAVVEKGVKKAGSAITLTWEDADAIASSIKGVSVAPEAQASCTASYGGENMGTKAIGVTYQFEWIRKLKLKEGRFITPKDVESSSLVAVMGSKLAKEMFKGNRVVGSQVKLGPNYFEVVGLLESKGGTGMGYEDDSVFVPISTVVRRMVNVRTPEGGHSISCLTVEVAERGMVDQKIDEISDLLRKRHRLSVDQDDDFFITSMKEQIKMVNELSSSFTIFLTVIAMISLTVAGIGIMNIMMVSVSERTHEIGICKSIGAMKRDILTQFALEAFTLTVGGGAAGVALGIWGLPEAIDGIVRLMGSGEGTPCIISPDIIIMSFGIALATGLLFGLYPAYKASSLNPVDALRKK